MATDKLLRQHVVNLLKSSEAHVDFEKAVKDLAPDLRGKKPKGAEHSPWELLEHLRIAQWDILEFSRNAKHKSPEFPAGYWPRTPAPPSEKAWEQSLAGFRKDLRAFCDLVSDESVDLFAKIPHGDGQTVLREALLAADHNAYHIGQLVLLRRILSAWD
ncbi:MAG TPA: DinB family protein [Candidatus Angelobacter sp.]|nr:DinB family protein [Candidatus Angelobacter sp.]